MLKLQKVLAYRIKINKKITSLIKGIRSENQIQTDYRYNTLKTMEKLKNFLEKEEDFFKVQKDDMYWFKSFEDKYINVTVEILTPHLSQDLCFNSIFVNTDITESLNKRNILKTRRILCFIL